MSGTLFLLVSVIAFAVTAALGKWMIPFLHKLKFGQTIREVGPSWHKSKQGTPTMGGLMFILGIAVAMMGCLPVFYSLGMEETLLMKVKVFAGLGMAVAFGAIGFMDDYIGIVKKRNLGLTERQKLVLQFAVAAAYLVSVALAGGNTATTIPFVGKIDLRWFYYPLAAIVIVGVTNAVNFTDGIDGLNTTVSFFAFLSLALCAGMLLHGGPVRPGVCLGGGLRGVPPVELAPRQGVHGGHGLPVHGGHGVRPGLWPGPAHPAAARGLCVPVRDPLRGAAGHLLQSHPR
mgnify:CR=1 FL=1